MFTVPIVPPIPANIDLHPNDDVARATSTSIPDSPSKRRRVLVEEIEDVEAGGLPKRPWIEDFPGSADRMRLSFRSSHTFYKKVDALPRGPTAWKREVFEAVGDVLGEDGKPKSEMVELWMRDAVDCVRELIENPAYRDSIRYRPERQYADSEGKTRIYGNIHTADWWWNLQMPEQSTIVPVILASDKTMLSRMSGDKSAWPVYLTIGNIEKNVRRKPSAHATVLLGYLPVAKLECFSEKRRSLEGYRLFHKCMQTILKPLVEAGQTGVLMTCVDGMVRRVYPIVAAYIADHPEQALVAACQENRCPKCPVEPNDRGEPVFSCLKDPEKVSAILKRVSEGQNPPEFAGLGLRAVKPFWEDLPHCDIFSALTPDILHQLHKGMFKDHIVSWATKAIEGGADEIDRRFKAMLKHSDLRHFKNGISLVSQWTGTEYKGMEKTFLGVVAGAGDERVTRAVRAVLDFIYYAHFETHTDKSLTHGLHRSWSNYHKCKAIFIELEIRRHFNFPKGHSTEHYELSIRSVGTADGYSTEHPERLHIDFAKLAYGASNKQDSYIKQMAQWLDRQEAVCRFSRYLHWAAGQRSPPAMPESPARTPTACASASRDKPGASRFRAEANLPIATAESHSHPELPLGDVEDASDISWTRSYQVAKTPAFPSMQVSQLVTDFGTTHFVWCLKDYLLRLATGDHTKLQAASIMLPDTALVAVYKQCKVRLPAISQVSSGSSPAVDIIHASPSHPGPNGLTTVPAYMSTVLARDPALSALRAADLPALYDAKNPLQSEFRRHVMVRLNGNFAVLILPLYRSACCARTCNIRTPESLQHRRLGRD
ncbi:hypothetical protein C8Q78DRAFT_965124 [Trametes maxima]|nr:hypothetical protein C8Q78DRAFT_965124 [Trametes maxima]